MPPDEREWVIHQLEKEKQAKNSAHSYTVWQALRHRDVLILTALHFVQNGSAYALAFWLPTMIKRLSGLSDIKVTLLVALPNLLGFVCHAVERMAFRPHRGTALAHGDPAVGGRRRVTCFKQGGLGNCAFPATVLNRRRRPARLPAQLLGYAVRIPF